MPFFIFLAERFHMSQFRFARTSLLVAALGFSTVPALMGIGPVAYAQAVRPEIGKPLQAAQELMKSKKYKDALAKIREADAVGGKTPGEQYLIEGTRASAAQMAGEYDTAAKSFEAVLASGKAGAAETKNIIMALPSLYFQTKNWPQAINALNRQLKEYGDDPKARAYLQQAYFQSGDYAKVQKEIQAAISEGEKAGRQPTEEQLQMLANAALRQNDKAGYVNAIEKLVAYYPKKDYWTDLLTRVRSKPGFAERLSHDLYRLKLATGQKLGANDFMEMAQLALQAGAPAEALKIIDIAYKNGSFGTGSEAPRQKRLQDLANQKAADFKANSANIETEAGKNKDGDTLVNLGFAYVAAGQAEKGLALMNQAIKEVTLKRPDDAKLHLGIAYFLAGKKSDAVKTLNTVQGKDGTAELARYWVLHINRAAS